MKEPFVKEPSVTVTPTVTHQQNIQNILTRCFGREFMAAVNRQGLDMEYLFGAPKPAPKNKKK